MHLRPLLLLAFLNYLALTLASHQPLSVACRQSDQLPLTPEDILGSLPPSAATAIAPSARTAFGAYIDALPVFSYTSITFDRNASLVVVTAIHGVTETTVDKTSFPAGEGAAVWLAAEEAWQHAQEDWLLGKSQEQIEAVFGWPEGLTHEQMQADIKATVAGQGLGGDEL